MVSVTAVLASVSGRKTLLVAYLCPAAMRSHYTSCSGVAEFPGQEISQEMTVQTIRAEAVLRAVGFAFSSFVIV